MSNDQPVTLGRFAVGSQPAFTIKCFTVAGTLATPTTLKVVTRAPDGTEDVYVAGTDSEIAAAGTGTYTFTLPQLTAAHVGSWWLRINTTGTSITDGTERAFECLESNFTTPLP